MKQTSTAVLLLAVLWPASTTQAEQDLTTAEVVAAVPDTALLRRAFDAQDEALFAQPQKAFYPETWFHYVNGNVDRQGITADLEAIARAGLAGVQFFHGGGFSDGWKGVTDPVYCLSEQWESLVAHTASEAQRLGLRFTMQNCPGWAMSGGPWIDLDHTMRHLAYSRTYVTDSKPIILPKTRDAEDPERDYRDIAVLAFPTPLGEQAGALHHGSYSFGPATANKPNVIDIQLNETAVARTLEFSSINGFNHAFCTNPGIDLRVEAIDRNGRATLVLDTEMPASNWQDSHSVSFALAEAAPTTHYRIEILNQNHMGIGSLRLLSAARKQNWEGEAAWTLRAVLPEVASAQQDKAAYINGREIVDLTDRMDSSGTLNWDKPAGNWTVLRIGHVNTKRQNGPAPAEATGWECDKLDPSGAALHFKNYIGRMANGPVKGKLSNMLMDSWECYTQTWTPQMPAYFAEQTHYNLRTWLPALFGFVVDNPETTGRFLNDWRRTLNHLYVENFFGQMARMAHEAGITCTYETAGGDITPADPMEYYKYADVPMCEFWQPFSNFLYNRSFKPIRPTASAARMYGKPRVSAESFTSFELTWDEHWQMLKDVANQNLLDGMTHFVFHTYTHNPGASQYFPGTSFGSNIGSPFLRGQTWWKHMPALTTYLARCTYMLERGLPSSSVLWYIGDEVQQKPDQFYPFPVGYKYDYCNPDALLTRITVKDGMWTTPEGIAYPLMWIAQSGRMMPETLERMVELVEQGGTLVGEAPPGIATLSTDKQQTARYERAVAKLWPVGGAQETKLGKGRVLRGMTIGEALRHTSIEPDVQGIGNQWLHRKTAGADWYFVCANKEQPFSGSVEFNCTGRAESWDPVSGKCEALPVAVENDKSTLALRLERGQCLFVVFRHDNKPAATAPLKKNSLALDNLPWLISFPKGWGVDSHVVTTELQPWHKFIPSAEGKAFSGTATYSTTLHIKNLDSKARYRLNLGRVEMIAAVRLNGKEIETLWTEPYETDITAALHKGDNALEIDVTSSWFNRLVYDASQPEESRKTWVIAGPGKEQPLRDNGLLGPVKLNILTP